MTLCSLCCQGYITVGYRGTFAIGRGDMSTTGFRKLGRILVCGKSALCREVFKVKSCSERGSV